MKVIHFQRRPATGQVSIERLFEQLRKAMPEGVECGVRVCPHLSRGVAPRMANILHARRTAGPINHIAGDVHYLALGLPWRQTILTIHDCASFERLRGFKRMVLRWVWYEWPMRHCAVVTTISESTRRELLRHNRCASEKIRVIHNCVGSEFVACPKPFSAECPNVLMVGTAENKNLPTAIAALAGLRCRLQVIGKLSDLQRRLLKEHGIVHSNTERASDEELVQAYRECDLLLFPSLYEGFGLPIVEAQAVGRPVVTSDLLSMPEVAGGAACLVDPQDVESIRAGVLRVCHDASYRQHLVQAGHENVKRFTPKAIAAQYASLYAEVAGTTGH